MDRVLAWQKFFVRPEIFMYAAIVLFAACFFVLSKASGNGLGGNLVSYYRQGNQENIIVPVVIILLLFLVRGIMFCTNAALRGLDPGQAFSQIKPKKAAKSALLFFKNIAFVGIPFVIGFYSLAFALGELNVLNSTRLVDEMLARWDILVTGTFLPLSIGAIQYPASLVAAIQFSFSYLVSGLTVFGLYLFQANQKLFREAAGAFFLAALISFAGWALFPVMSPHDRYIDNVYSAPVPADIQAYVDGYTPQAEMQRFLDVMRQNKQGLSVMPTSTFPSAHVVWAVFLVYYSWRVTKWFLLGTVPFAVLSSIGTFFFAQHYFVDVPAGIAVAVVSIAIARFLAKKQEQFA